MWLLSKKANSMSRAKLIVGIDYGTTFSGIAYVTSDKSGIDDITVVTTWPDSSLSSWKVPTVISYAEENPKKINQDTWGYTVKANLKSCSWTKLLFDSSTSHYDDPSIQAAVDDGIMRLPESPCPRTPQQVCEDYLTHVYKHFMGVLVKQIGENYLQSTPMDCWLTVPAVWSDAAQNMTKIAAQAAGFGSREKDSIHLITEPEAAAISVLKSYLGKGSPNAPEVGDGILICDCGGGTVDITTYSIKAISPALRFEELCVGVGGKCGSTYIDRNLHQLMRDRFGSKFENLESRKKGPRSRFMEEWDRVKRNFGVDSNNVADFELQLALPGVPSSEWYDADEDMVLLSREDIEGLFEPVVDRIICLVGEQVEQVTRERGQIKKLVLVGGFGDSAYLYTRLKSWSASRSIQVLCPSDPQAAVVRGAAMRGLEGTVPSARRARRHYGVEVIRPFRSNIDPEYLADTSPWDKSKLCLNRVHWFVEKGTKLGVEEAREVEQYFTWDKKQSKILYVKLYSCALDRAPDYTHSERVDRVGVLRVDFSNAPKRLFEHRRDHGWWGRKRYQFTYTISTIFGGSSGNLDFKTLVDGVITGTASITFD